MKIFNKLLCVFLGHKWHNYTRYDGSFRHGDCRVCGKKGNWTEEDENSKEFFPMTFIFPDGTKKDASMSRKEIEEIFNRENIGE